MPTRKLGAARQPVGGRSDHKYGWVPDLPDHRDYVYAAPAPTAAAPLPPRVDLTPQCPPVYDQDGLNSCTANAIAAALEFDQRKQHTAAPFTPSRLFIYYDERALEGTVNSDAGAVIRDGVKSVSKEGVCPELHWPYVAAEVYTKPLAACYQEALQHRAIVYERIARTLNQMRGCLASGYPFVFGFAVYESFESSAVARSGHAPMPGHNEKRLGGHAVLAVGYDDGQRWFLVRNSWGAGWGLHGYFTLPYAYLMDPNLSDDFWTIRRVQVP
jgi:C1A family cysteine protease